MGEAHLTRFDVAWRKHLPEEARQAIERVASHFPEVGLIKLAILAIEKVYQSERDTFKAKQQQKIESGISDNDDFIENMKLQANRILSMGAKFRELLHKTIRIGV